MAPPAASLAGLPWPELRGYIDQQSASAAARAPVADLLAQAEVHDRAVAAAQAVVGPGSNEGMLVAYLSFCNAVVHTMTNPRFAAAKKDPAFRARIDRLKVLYDARRIRAADLKASLFPGLSASTSQTQAAPAPAPTSSPAGHKSTPSDLIGDRLNALRGMNASPAVHHAAPSNTPATNSSPTNSSSPSLPPAPGAFPGSSPPKAPFMASGARHQRDGSALSIPRAPSAQSMNGETNGDKRSSLLGPRPPPAHGSSKRDSQVSSTDDVDRFERAFPSVDTIGRQFDSDGFAIPSVPNHVNGTNGPSGLAPAGDSADSFLMSLPSVPTSIPGSSKPGLDPPPPRPDRIDVVPSPPSPDLISDIKRPASTPATHDPLASSLSVSPPTADFAGLTLGTSPDPVSGLVPFSGPAGGPSPGLSSTHSDLLSWTMPDVSSSPPVPPPPVRHTATQSSMPLPNRRTDAPLTGPSPTPSHHSSSSAYNTTTAASGAMPVRGKKPDFPLTTSITPDTLRSYFLNLSVDVLILDVRPETEFWRGYVGHQYVERDCKINVVWIDPTILMRDGLNSTGLEDALSVSPEGQRLAFQNRYRYDLVVICDTRSTRLPAKGEAPTPAGRLFSIIGENEFVKPLPRFPALLVGGYEGWVEFIKQRQSLGEKEYMRMLQARARANSGATNGHDADATSDISDGSASDKKLNRSAHVYKPSPYSKSITDSFSAHGTQSMSGSISMPSAQPYLPPPLYQTPSYSSGSSLSYPLQSMPPSRSSIASPPLARPGHMHSPSLSAYSSQAPIAALPRATINSNTSGVRRQSSYDNPQYSGVGVGTPGPYGSPHRPQIDYPQAHALTQVPQPPPPAVAPSLERVGPRAPPVPAPSQRSLSLRVSEQLNANNGIRYWSNAKLGIAGLKNLGNTCYMNSTLQCLSATVPFARFFLDGRFKREVNIYNDLGTRGNLANAFSALLSALWGETYKSISPVTFRSSIVKFKPDFGGTEQHDSQEFLSFVMDGLHEDLNRIRVRPKPTEMSPEREHYLETLPPQIASDREWQIYKERNDSIIVDLFQGQYMNRMECLTCHKVSTTYDSFQWLTLDLPASKAGVSLSDLIDRWVRPEILDGDEKWYCPRCKVRRRATKTLTLVRLPPVLLIHLKRFLPVDGGRFYNKSDTPVRYPLEGLDLTRYVPARQLTGGEDMDDPRTQIGPFRYDLYAVSSHVGTLSSGHYTAYVRSGDQWIFCDDSSDRPVRREELNSRPAYILFYKRVMA